MTGLRGCSPAEGSPPGEVASTSDCPLKLTTSVLVGRGSVEFRLRGQQGRVGQTPWKPRAVGLCRSSGPPLASSHAQKGEGSQADSMLITTKAVILVTSSGITLAPACWAMTLWAFCLISNICVSSENMIPVLQPLSHLDVLRL